MPVDLATVTRDTFEPHRGTRFALHTGDDAGPETVLEIELLDIQGLPTAPGRRAAFLLRFRAGSPAALPQRIYRLEHPVLGALELFLVPAGPDAVGMRYDAVFS